ncbi:MAG: hypothetical protein QME14_07780 [Methanobacteriaceae archaeon]|nr:hypothetical protein [Methanobacteriaceae archaeon]
MCDQLESLEVSCEAGPSYNKIRLGWGSNDLKQRRKVNGDERFLSAIFKIKIIIFVLIATIFPAIQYKN